MYKPHCFTTMVLQLLRQRLTTNLQSHRNIVASALQCVFRRASKLPSPILKFWRPENGTIESRSDREEFL
jgi:hypothetical protein